MKLSERIFGKKGSSEAVAKKSLFASGAALLFSFAVLVSALTYAWFASNKKTDTGGMNIQADTSANVVISDSTEQIVKNLTEINVGSPYTENGDTAFKVTVTADSRKLQPAMHSDESTDTLLVRSSDNTTVSPSTGLTIDENGDPSLVDVEEAEDSPYYIDYVVYIASTDKQLVDASLTAQITAPTEDLTNTKLGATIDFFVDGVYADTLNLAGLELSNDSAYDASATKTEATLITDGVIPCNKATSGNQYITVTMRCYFDGALHCAENETYVKTNGIDTSSFTLGVSFVADGTEADAE